MPTVLDAVTQAAMQLSSRQKLVLAEHLMESADAEGGIDADAEQAWEAEIQDRIRGLDQGEVAGVSYEEVMNAAERRLAL